MSSLSDLVIVLGLVAIAIGVALVHIPSAVVVGGLELLVIGIAIARRPHGILG